MEFKDYYGVLGVSRQATPEEIKRAYRRMARKYHPDVSKEADAELRFKEVQEAYEVLKDPEKRATYDRVGSDWKTEHEFRPPPDWDKGFEFSGDFSDQEMFSDFFESLFGRGSQSRKTRPSGVKTQQKQGQDHHAKISIDLEDAYYGKTRAVSLATPVVDARGQATTRNRTLNVKIPVGITPGQRIRLVGQGTAGANGSKGDLYLEIWFSQHRIFHVEQRNILLDLPITPWEAALGRTIVVPTLGGKVDLRIPAGSQSGNKLRLKERGLPGSPQGDQIITLRIVIPEAHTSKAKALYERMEKELPLNPRANLS